MDEIHTLLDIEANIDDSSSMINMVEDAYQAIHEHDNYPILRDLSILIYMQQIESIKAISLKFQCK